MRTTGGLTVPDRLSKCLFTAWFEDQGLTSERFLSDSRHGGFWKEQGYHMLVTGRKNLLISPCGARPAWNKHVGDLWTSHCVQQQQSTRLLFNSKLLLMYIWFKKFEKKKGNKRKIQVFPCFAASPHIKMNLNAKKQTFRCIIPYK